MTIESTQPQPEQGPAQDNGQVQSQGHRRRRRRRKNKSSQQGGAQQRSRAQSQPQQQASRASTAAPAGPIAAAAHQQQPAPGRTRAEEEEILPEEFRSAGAARQQHLRAAAGQAQGAAEGPARPLSVPWTTAIASSTATWPTGRPRRFQITSNGHGGATILTSLRDQARPRAVREDAPTRIFCFIEDLFFLAKIQETARKLGVKVEFVKGDKEVGGAHLTMRRKRRGPRCWSSI